MRTMRRGLAAAFTCASVLAMTAGAGAAPVTAPAARAVARPPTVVRSVSPVDAAGALKPRYDVKRHYDGARCQSGSAVTGTSYRCYTSRSPQGVYDPCWVTSTSARVICVDVPWRRHKVTQ